MPFLALFLVLIANPHANIEMAFAIALFNRERRELIIQWGITIICPAAAYFPPLSSNSEEGGLVWQLTAIHAS